MQPAIQMNTIEGRRDQSEWIGVAFLFIIGALIPLAVFMQPPRDTEERIAVALLFCLVASPFLIGAIYLGILLVRSRVKADESGLYWQSIRHCKYARWEEITDYYIQKVSKEHEKLIVVTSHGNLDLKNYPKVATQLQQMVQDRARSARATEWELEGTRIVDEWPRTFTYNPKQDREFPWLVAAMFLFFPASLMANSDSLNPLHLLRNTQQMFNYLSLEMKVAFGLTLLSMSLVYPLIILSALPRVRATTRRKGQRIAVDLDGICFDDGTSPIQATWPEVTSYYIAPIRGWVTVDALFVVETKRGNFDFCGIMNERLLQAIISRYATDATPRDWRRIHDEGVQKDHSVSTLAGQRRCIYTYRTATNRALLWLFTAMAALLPLSHWMSLQVGGHPGRDVIFIGIFIGFISLLLWVLYFSIRITTDEVGIEYRFLWRTNRLPWQEMKDLSQGSFWLSVIGSNVRVRLTPLIGGYKQLCDEICLRAVNSRTREWKSG